MTCGVGRATRRPSDPRHVLHRSWRQPRTHGACWASGCWPPSEAIFSEAEHLLLAAVNRAELEHDNGTIATALH